MNLHSFTLSTIVSAGELLLKERDRNFTTSSKEGDYRNLVTSVDIIVDDFIKKSIKSSFPDDQIYSEESTENDVAINSFWSIDPIDGTSNFARGIPHFAVCLAYI